MLQRVRVLIMGAGIGGCSLWLALRQQTERSLVRGRGPVFSATVFEQCKRIEPVGAGIALGPNGLRVLDSLGLLDRLKVLGGDVSKLKVYTDKGQLLRSFDCTFLSRRHGYPMLCMERAELQALLVHQLLRSEATAPIPGKTSRPMRFGKKCVSVHDQGGAGEGVVVRFEDGTEAVGDVVIGADGATSAVRAAVFGCSISGLEQQASTGRDTKLRPEYSGISCLLGVTSSVPESIAGSAYWVLGPGRFYGTWSMGRRKQYWFLTRREELLTPGAAAEAGSKEGGESAGDGGDMLEEGRWTPADALHGMDEMWNWFHPYDAHAMFSRTVRAVKVGFYELPRGQRLPLVGRHGCRVAMLGDAAHAMLPTVHQGANMAVEDAAVLAGCLSSRFRAHADVSAASREGTAGVAQRVEDASAIRSGNEAVDSCVRSALQDYSSTRVGRVRRVADMSRRTGMWQTSSSASVDFLRTSAIRWVPHSILEGSLDWIYSYRTSTEGPDSLH